MPQQDRDLITRATQDSLRQQIDGLVANEPKLVEQFRAAPITIRTSNAGDAEAAIQAFDKIWVEKAPILTELRKVGASL
jgi:TRAP-type C4-dicarboxylate transport system substrate-binding protein